MALAPSPTLTALTVAGSDPSGGAGVQADLRAFEALGVHGASVLTVVTAQGTRGVRKADPLRPAMVRAELDAVFEDLAPRAAKTGALGNAGQADYATANAYLDAFARHRAPARWGRTVAIDWPLWAEGGMAIDDAKIGRAHG
mgnify:CR=1 FL=1